jgi:hypothetical protein
MTVRMILPFMVSMAMQVRRRVAAISLKTRMIMPARIFLITRDANRNGIIRLGGLHLTGAAQVSTLPRESARPG